MASKALKFISIKCDNFQFNYELAGAKHTSKSFWQGKLSFLILTARYRLFIMLHMYKKKKKMEKWAYVICNPPKIFKPVHLIISGTSKKH